MHYKPFFILGLSLLGLISLQAQTNFIATPPGYTSFAPRIASNGFIYNTAVDETPDHNYAIFQVDPVSKANVFFPADTALGGFDLRNFMVVGNLIFCTGRFGLLKIDPLNNNVKKVVSFAGGTGVYLFTFSNKVFFTNTSGRAYVYDPQTQLVDTLKYNGVAVNPGKNPQVIFYNDLLYFLGQGTGAQSSAVYLYRYDGAGSNLVRSNINVANSTFTLDQSAYSTGTLFTPLTLNNRLVFFVMDGIPTKHLAALDITNFNNVIRTNIWSFGNNFNHLTAFNNKLYFRDNDKIFSTDANGVFALASDVPMTGFASLPNNGFAVVNGKLIGTGNDSNGTELWSSDGTTAGTQLMYNLFEGTFVNADNAEIPKSGSPHSAVVYNDSLYFLARGAGTLLNEGDYDFSYYVWKTNGTPEGTSKYSSIECDGYMMTIGAFSETNLSAALNGKLGTDIGTFTAKPIWFAGGNSVWENGLSWSSNIVPTAKDDVIVNNGTISVNSIVTVRSLTTINPATVQVAPGAQIIIAQ